MSEFKPVAGKLLSGTPPPNSGAFRRRHVPRNPVKATLAATGFPSAINFIRTTEARKKDIMVSRLLTLPQAAFFLGVREQFLRDLLDNNMGPATVQRKSYSLEYHIDDLRAYKGSNAMLADYNKLLALGVT